MADDEIQPKKLVTYKSPAGLCVWFYADSGCLQFDFRGLRERDETARLERVTQGISAVTGRTPRQGVAYPSIPPAAAVHDWSRTRVEILDPYFE